MRRWSFDNTFTESLVWREAIANVQMVGTIQETETLSWKRMFTTAAVVAPSQS